MTEGGEGAAPSAEVKSTDAKVPRWKRRTPEQIEANKLAQKRFRCNLTLHIETLVCLHGYVLTLGEVETPLEP